MPFDVIDSSLQDWVKNSYAACPEIDLTVRADGERRVSVIDSTRHVIPAGISAATATPTVANGAAGTFPNDKFWAYVYVYAADKNFPLVQNERTGGGNLGPRGNPSPPSATQSGASSTNQRVVTLTNNTTEWWVTAIWIYRTKYFNSAAEAANAAAASSLFWIGTVPNNPSIPTVTFTDNNLALRDQVENDNFPAPQFKRIVYSNQFFWGFCNDPLEREVIVDATGFVTLNDPVNERWFDGRNGQFARLQGIEAGGYDNNGTFFWKWISLSEAQLYNDIQLTSIPTLGFTGTTMLKIFGPSTRLFRSKINNPLSWGTTDVIGVVQVPQPYFFDVGGGRGKAITILPNLNMLKLDVENPNNTFTLNLKLAGTVNFEPSKRTMAQNYCSSIHESQFSATLDKGQNVIWGLDTKASAIVECDGGNQNNTSTMVFKSIRRMILDGSSEQMFHGAYGQRLELNCQFIRTIPDFEGGSPGVFDYLFPFNDKLIFQHGPTGLWGTCDVYDMLSSCEMIDRGIARLVVGTSTGYIGELFEPNTWWHWFKPGVLSTAVIKNPGFGQERKFATGTFSETLTSHSASPTFWEFGGTTPIQGIIGNWVTIRRYRTTNPKIAVQTFICRVDAIDTDFTGGDRLHFDKVLQRLQTGYVGILPTVMPRFSDVNYADADWVSDWYIGLIETVAGRSFTGKQPQNNKKLEEIWTSWMIPSLLATTPAFPPQDVEAPTFEVILGYPEPFNGFYEFRLDRKSPGDKPAPVDPFDPMITKIQPYIYAKQSAIPIDLGKVFSVVFRDRVYGPTRLLNYDLMLDLTD